MATINPQRQQGEQLRPVRLARSSPQSPSSHNAKHNHNSPMAPSPGELMPSQPQSLSAWTFIASADTTHCNCCRVLPTKGRTTALLVGAPRFCKVSDVLEPMSAREASVVLAIIAAYADVALATCCNRVSSSSLRRKYIAAPIPPRPEKWVLHETSALSVSQSTVAIAHGKSWGPGICTPSLKNETSITIR